MKNLLLSLVAVAIMFASAYAGRSDIAITVYNNDLALVKELRPIEFKKGIFDFRFTDVPARIDATSVHFRPGKSANKISILEQNFQYDLVSPDKIFDKYIDNQITAVGENGRVYEGTLLSHGGGSIVIAGDDGSLTVVRTEELTDYRFAKLPEGLLTKPTLVWKFDSDVQGTIDCNVSYLTSGIGWHAEYVAVVAEDDKSLELSGWVSIENNSGGSFENAKVKLIAGDVHRVESAPRAMKGRPRAMDMLDSGPGAPQFEEKSFFEYHLYTLQRRTTIANSEIKQITLFPASDAKAKKVYTFEGLRYGYGRGTGKPKVKVTLEFKNSKSDGLGMALPKGKIRVYKADSDQSLEFIGEDQIDHTPKDELVRVFVGNAFDIIGERKVIDRKKISQHVSEETIEIKLRNHKEEAVEVVVVEKLWSSDWKIKKPSHKYHKKDANTAEFNIPVEPDGETVLTYTVRHRF